MKKFLGKCLLFIIIVLCACVGFIFLSAKEPTKAYITRWTNSQDYSGESGMLPYFERAKAEDGTTRLLIGDSICRQLFLPQEAYNPDVSMLPANAALMITGQYLLAEKYLESHNDATDIYLVMHPLTLTRTWDREWSYRYAVMPAIETDTFQLLDENTVRDIQNTYGRLFTNKAMVQLIEESPMLRKLYLSYEYINGKEYVQNTPFEISDQYIRKLSELCDEKGVKFHLYSSPVAEYYREKMVELGEDYKDTWMYSRFPKYMDSLFFYPSEWAGDLSHFSGEYAEQDKLNEIIYSAYAGTELLQDIVCELK